MSTYSEGCLYKDTYTIIEMMDDEMREKINENFIKFLFDNRDNSFEGTINPTIPLRDQELNHQLQVMLSLIYINYICDEETKERLEKEEEIKKEKYREEIVTLLNEEKIY